MVKVRWYYPSSLGLINQQQRTQIKATVMSHNVKVITILFEWEGEVYLQGEGCPTRLRPSGPLSRIVMDHWVQEMKQHEDKEQKCK